MDDDEFKRVLNAASGKQVDALTEKQRAELSKALAATTELSAEEIKKQENERQASAGKTLLVFIAWGLALFAAMQVGNDIHWFVAATTLTGVAWWVVYLIWRPRDKLVTSTELAVWLWGGVMAVLAFNLGAVVIIASQCTAAFPEESVFFSKASEGCNTADRKAVLQFFLAAKEFGSVLAVALGFVSIAWIQSYTRKSQ